MGHGMPGGVDGAVVRSWELVCFTREAPAACLGGGIWWWPARFEGGLRMVVGEWVEGRNWW